VTTFAVGDRVRYTYGGLYKNRKEGTILRVIPNLRDRYMVDWDGASKSGNMGTPANHMELSAPTAPEEYESWFQ